MRKQRSPGRTRRRRLATTPASTPITEQNNLDDSYAHQPTQTIRRRKGRATRKFILWGLSSLITLLGGVAAVANLLPRVAVDPSFTWDGRNPLTTEFLVKNSGYIPLRDVRCICAFFSTNGGRLKRHGSATGTRDTDVLGFMHPEPLAAELPIDGQVTTNCNFLNSECETCKLGVYDLGLVIKYKPIGLPVQRHSVFRLVSTVATDGSIHWTRQPMTPETEYHLSLIERSTPTMGGGPVQAAVPKHEPPPVGK